MILLDGKEVSKHVREEIRLHVEQLKEKTGKVPFLVAILVGDDPASHVYVRNKKRACEKAGMKSEVIYLPAETTQQELLDKIDELNHNTDVNGILVQLPLPDHIDEERVIDAIRPEKDVDCFHPYNVGRMVTGNAIFYPATPYGITEILKYYKIDTNGKHAVVLGRSNIVGKPMANMLVQKSEMGNATVTIAHSRTKNLKEITRQADILIAAIGKPEYVKKDMLKEGAIVIDVGINRIDDPSTEKGYRLVGDVDFEEVKDIVSAITPVPGGVGPMTITMLLRNTVKAFEVQNGIQ
ncbi:MAG: bifunctional methylenetetrahydrofolate dehydrogenase/methenyltetrahydrofolate cyclohydrolase FolD [Methanobacteriota archaeon]|nr:MAG: bifunctional methylenetetrahydrofolate dehydrogenase/methenyltetrahydrofolate cyclohydrolase FolD [Euryarchaeota archaeon]